MKTDRKARLFYEQEAQIARNHRNSRLHHNGYRIVVRLNRFLFTLLFWLVDIS